MYSAKLPLTEALARRVAELRAHFDDVPPEHRQCFTDRANELDFYRQKLLDAEQPEDAVRAKLDCYTYVEAGTVCAEILIKSKDWLRIYDPKTRTLRVPLEVSKTHD